MGKFGKKTHVSLNPMDCSIIFLGSPKLGKTTIMKEIAEKCVGEDSYMFFEMYRESGADHIEGINYEPIETWDKFREVVEDIEENKDTDYPDLKVIFIDTWDNAILLAEKEAVRLWNKNNPENRTDNINQAYSGFNRGQDKAADLLDEMKFRLEAVGIKVQIIMHLKNKEITDPITSNTYQQVTADVSQKYFNRIKKNADIIAVGFVDREIVNEKTGRKDIKGKDITANIVKEESRKIKFRDSGYVIDAGSRLKHIAEEIDFSANEFISAIEAALKAEVQNSGVSLADREKEDKEREKVAAEKASETSKYIKANKIDEARNEEIKSIIQSKLGELDAETKTKFKQLMADNNIANFKDVSTIPTTTLEKLVSFF